MAALLRLEKVRKSFGGLVAVNDVNLEIHSGEVRSIIGPNGAGKTTLFNLITQFYSCDTGSAIYFKDENITHLPAQNIVHKGIVRTFQRSNSFPKLTVLENVMIPLLKRYGYSWNMVSRANRLLGEEVQSILEDVGLSELSKSVSGLLSHGHQRRLELAIALANNPSLLLLDEPTSGMTVDESAEAMDLVVRLNRKQGLTILFTEHDMKVVFRASQWITVLNFGTVIADGTPDEIRANPEVQRVYLGESRKK